MTNKPLDILWCALIAGACAGFLAGIVFVLVIRG